MSSFMFKMVVMYLMYISKCNASAIYGNIGDNVTFSWTLDPIPGEVEIVAVKNPAGSLMFQALGTTPIVDSAYTGRIIYNGNTTAGQMRFTLKSITQADPGLYKASYGAVIYSGQTLYVYEAQGIYGNVGDDIKLSWMLDPIPRQGDIVGVYNPAGSLLFQALGTTPIVESAYTGRIVYNGNTTAGQMRFTLKSITQDDAGLYKASYGLVTYLGQTLYVYGKPTRPSVTEMSAPVANSNLQLNCSTISTTVPNNHNVTMIYRWNIDGVNITSSIGRYITNGSHITIQNIKLNDENTTVACTGTEQGGLTSLISIVYKVNPEYGPGTVTFTPSTTRYPPTELSSIPDIICSADCKPNCNYRWTKDGQVTSHGSGSTLSLRNINRIDTGVYRCTSWNDHGTKNSTVINVDVKYGPGTVFVTPSTTSYSPTELSIIPDITCSADCKPNCNYRWTKDGQVTSHGFGSTLSLRNINRNDTGVYRCTARNDLGTKNSTDINVYVKFKPTPSKPIDKVYLFDLYKYTEIKLTYLANPKPEFTWFHDDGYGNFIKQSSGSNNVLINNSQENAFTHSSQLTLIDLQREYLGKYRIFISSPLGVRFDEIVVAAKGMPHQPTDVKIFCETANIALLIWTSQLNGGKEQKFSIKYWVKEDLKTEISLPTKDPGFGKQMHYFIRQLKNKTNYTFVIVAKNAYGETVSSRVSCFSQETNGNCNKYMPINAALIVGPVFGSIVITILVTLSVIGLVRRKMEKNHKTNSEERPYTEQGDRYNELDIVDNTNVYTVIEQQGAYENQMNGTERNEFQYEQIQTSSVQLKTNG